MGVLISRSAGTIISLNFTSDTVSFDGNLSQGAGACSTVIAPAAAMFIGKDWGAGVTHNLDRFRCFSPNDDNFTRGTGGTFTIELRGNSSAPVTGSEGTLLRSIAAANAGANEIVDTSTGITAGNFRYHWCLFVLGGGAADARICEIQFYQRVARTSLLPLVGVT